MMVVEAFALLLVAAAVVVLFAMMGELASRIPDPDGGAGRVTPLTEFSRGASAAPWPAGLASVADQNRTALVVLSPICATCNKVAVELAGYRPDQLGESLGVVVSCNSREAGEEFVDRYSLGHFPVFVDEGGAWVTGNFGVKMSPSALVFEEGVLTDAYTFSTVEALQGQIVKVKEGVS
jgi:hypothetical protein